MTLSRRDSFTIQAFQLLDAVLVGLSFWTAGEFRDVVLYLSGRPSAGENEITSMMWVLYISVPFTPLVLERFGFYDRVRHKTGRQAALQLFQGLIVITLFVGMFSVFAKLVDTRRLILGFGIIFTFIFLLIRTRISRYWLKHRIKTGLGREQIVIAGTLDEIDALLTEIDPEITSEWNIVERFDLGGRPVQDLY
ncbi:MAG: hypothetical protein EOP84_00005, partial [Verrucomicrobiaceae bacterium]